MAEQRFVKAPNILVTRNHSGGLNLTNLSTGDSETIDGLDAKQWMHWPACHSVTPRWHPPESLLSGKFVIKTDQDENSGFSRNISTCDNQVPHINGLNVTWHYESSDLAILHNSTPMARINPLLALGPYGTLCWRAIEERKSIKSIRTEAESVFGADEVLPFLKRLCELEFLMPIPNLGRTETPSETIMKEFPAPEVQWRLRHAALPWYCLWELSTTCDLRCRICYLPDFADAGFDTGRALEVAQQIVDSGAFYVCLLGGEVLLRNDLEKLVEKLRAQGLYVKIISNGIKLLPERARALASAGLNQIEISFDGLSAEVHEKSRGPGTFSKAERGLRSIQAGGISRSGIVWTVHQDNFRELEKLPDFMYAHEVRECYISLFKKAGLMGASSSFQSLNSNQIDTVRTALTNWKEQYSELNIVLLPGCSCGRTSVIVGSSGDVRLCSFSQLPVGNVFRRTLSDIWFELKQTLPASGAAGFCAANATVQLGRSIQILL